MRKLGEGLSKARGYSMLTLIVFTLIFGILFVVLGSSQLGASLTKQPLPSHIPKSPREIERFIAENEMKFPIKSNNQKVLLNANLSRGKSPTSFIYIHGFSASRMEISPVFETLSKNWDSPLFMTRLHGHGLGPDDLGNAKMDDWINDALEALTIGLTLGEKVVITCTSTGCALGLYLAYFYPEKIEALILVSPNFAPANPMAFLANGPLGPTMTRIFEGPYRKFDETSPSIEAHWTTLYGTRSIPEMVSLVTAVKNLDLETIRIPTLTLYTPHDDVVSVPEIQKHAPRLSSPLNQIISLDEAKNHVLAGDLRSPETTEKVIKLCDSFLAGFIKKYGNAENY